MRIIGFGGDMQRRPLDHGLGTKINGGDQVAEQYMETGGMTMEYMTLA